MTRLQAFLEAVVYVTVIIVCFSLLIAFLVYSPWWLFIIVAVLIFTGLVGSIIHAESNETYNPYKPRFFGRKKNKEKEVE